MNFKNKTVLITGSTKRTGFGIAEIAHLALFLASPEAVYITGQAITIDGGCLAQLLPKGVEA